MAAISVTKPHWMTVEEYDRLPDNERYYLIQGELCPMPPMPGYQHGDITNLFALKAGSHVLNNRLGKCFAAETRFLITRHPDSSLGPDWAFVRRENLPQGVVTGSSPVVPDAVLEVRSPSQSQKEAEDKIALWIEAGVRMALE